MLRPPHLAAAAAAGGTGPARGIECATPGVITCLRQVRRYPHGFSGQRSTLGGIGTLAAIPNLLNEQQPIRPGGDFYHLAGFAMPYLPRRTVKYRSWGYTGYLYAPV